MPRNVFPFVKLPGLVIFFTVIFLSACGGSGGGSDSDSESEAAVTAFSQLNKGIFTGDTYQDSEVSRDSNGDDIVRTKLAILFRPSATKAEVDALLVRINATVTASVAGSRSLSIRIHDPITVDALEIIIADIEGEAFVEAVLKSVVDVTTAIPDNVDVDTAAFNFVKHHAAVGGAAAWNARKAISSIPDIILMDFLGAGSSPLVADLDANLSGNVAIGVDSPMDHGYHVAGIITAAFGGRSFVTGMFPGRSNLSIIDLKNGITDFDARVLAVNRAIASAGTVVMNTSLGKRCQSATTSNTCREKSVAMQGGILWADLVRAAGIEGKLFHTKSAGNRRNPAPDMRDTQTNHSFATAATMTDMVTADGTPVPPLTNTMVVERLDGIGSPREVNCLNDNSFVGGHISAIGTNVFSLSQIGGGTTLSGTSMASPQVAGLAAYMLAIDASLTPQGIKEILLDTAQVVAIGLDAACSDWPRPAPAIDAYAAVLALDGASALTGSIANAPVRNAILDISNNGTDIASNSRFDEFDLMYYLQQIEQGSQDKIDGTAEVKYSRADLNGDGYDGGADGYEKKFNLDIDYPPAYTVVTQTIEGEVVEFDEASLTDNDILCYYAYSDLYTGSAEQRRLLVAPRCRRGIMAVYVRYYRQQTAVGESGINSNCPATPALLTEERETLSTRPMRQTFPVAMYETRPASQYWLAGDRDTEINTRRVAGDRRFQTGFDGTEPVCVDVAFATETEFNSTLEHAPNGNRLNVDVLSRAESDCRPDPDNGVLQCATSLTQAQWQAEFDYTLRTPLNLQLVMQLSCAATSDRVAVDPDVPNPESIGNMELSYSTSRYDHTGVRVSTAPAQVFTCPESGIVNIAQDINLAAPAVAGTTDNIVIRVSARQQINTPGTNGFVEGSTYVENRMNGFIEVQPGG